MTTRTLAVLVVIAATTAACTTPPTATRSTGIDLVRTTAVTGTYR